MPTLKLMSAWAVFALVVGSLALVALLAFGAYRDGREASTVACSYRQIESAARRVRDRVGALDRALANALTPARPDDPFIAQRTGGGADACERLRERFQETLRLGTRSDAAPAVAPGTPAPDEPSSRDTLRKVLESRDGSLVLRFEKGVRPADTDTVRTGCREVPGLCTADQAEASRLETQPIGWVAAELPVDRVVQEVTSSPGGPSLFRDHVIVREDDGQVVWQSKGALPDGVQSLTDLLPVARSPARTTIERLLGAAGLLQGVASGTPDGAPAHDPALGEADRPGGGTAGTTRVASAIASWRPLAVQLRGDPHRVLCQKLGLAYPMSGRDAAAGPEGEASGGLALCGFLEEGRLQAEASVLRSEWLAPALTILALLLTALPLVKLWTMAEPERLAARDIRLLVGAAFVAAGLATFVLAEGTARRALRDEFDGQLEELAHRAEKTLRHEIDSAVTTLVALRPQLEGAAKSELQLDGPAGSAAAIGDLADVIRVKTDGSLERYYAAVSRSDPPTLQTLQLVPSPGIRVDERTYFRDAQGRRFRQNAAGQKYTLQIAASKTTGRPLVIVGIPAAELLPPDVTTPIEIAILSLHPHALSQPHVPEPFGFALIQASGAVLLHSDPTRNESENLLDETGRSEALAAALWSRRAQILSAPYEARPHRFLLQPLAGLDLTLVAFYDQQALDAVSWEVFGRWATLAGPYFASGIGFLLFVWLVAPRYRAPWLWPDRERVGTVELLGLTVLVLLTAAIGAAAVDLIEVQEAISIRQLGEAALPLLSAVLLLGTPLAGISGIALRVSCRRPLSLAERVFAAIACAGFLVFAVVLLVMRWRLQATLPGGSWVLWPWIPTLTGLTLLWLASPAVAALLLRGWHEIQARTVGGAGRTGDPRTLPGTPEPRTVALRLGATGALALIVGLLGAWALRPAPVLAAEFALVLAVGLGPREQVRRMRNAVADTGSWLLDHLRHEAAFRGTYAMFLTSVLVLVAVAPSFVLHRNARHEVEFELSQISRITLGREAGALAPGIARGLEPPEAHGGSRNTDSLRYDSRHRREARRIRAQLWATSWLATPLVPLAEAAFTGRTRSDEGTHGLRESPRPLSAHMGTIMPPTADPRVARLRARARDALGALDEESRASLRLASKMARRAGPDRRATGRDPYRQVTLLAAGLVGLLTLLLVRSLTARLFVLDADVSDAPERRFPRVLRLCWRGAGEADRTHAPALEIDLRSMSEPRDLTLGAGGVNDDTSGERPVVLHRLEFVLADDLLRRALLAALQELVSRRNGGTVLVSTAVDPVRFLEALLEERIELGRPGGSSPAAASGPGDPGTAPASGTPPAAAELPLWAELRQEIAAWSSLVARAECTVVDLQDQDLEEACDPAFAGVDLQQPYRGDREFRHGQSALDEGVLRESYGRLWATLDRREQLTMIQLQQEGFVNPARESCLARLMERGLVNRCPTLAITPPALGRFVGVRESRATVRQWETPVQRSAWGFISPPLAFAAGALALLLLALQGETETHAATIIGAGATAIPMLLRILGFTESARGEVAVKS